MNIFLAVALGISTKKLWMMIGTLQIIAHFPLLRISFPSNALMCFKAIVEVANMNIVPKSATNKVLSLVSHDSSPSSIKGNFKMMDIFSIFTFPLDKLLNSLFVHAIVPETSFIISALFSFL